MASDLDEIVERLNFCEAEIETVRSEIRAYFREVVETKSIQSANGTLHMIRVKELLRPAIRSRVGTTINEIRSCLDALACVLAERNGKSTSGTYFPISKTKEIFEDDGLKWKLKKVSASDRAVIQEMTPYGGARDFLFGMHEFDRVRKHRRLGVSNPAGGVFVQEGYVDAMYVPGIAALTAEWQTAALLGPGSEALLGFECIAVFEEPEQLAGMPIPDALERFLSEARDVLLAFS